MSGASDLANRKRAEQTGTRDYNPRKVVELVTGLIGQMRLVRTITPIEMIGVGDGILITVANTVLEVAEPGEQRESARKHLLEIIDRMRRDVELGPNAPTTEVM